MLVLSLLAAPAAATAQETIFDPENPAVSGAEDESEEAESDDDTSEEDDSDTETILDPENPAVQTDDAETQTGEDEEVEPTLADIDSEEGGGESNASFVGEYGSALGVDTSWDGREDIVEWSNQLDLRVEYDIDSSSRVVVEGRFRHWMAGRENPDETNLLFNASDPRASYEARLDEAYLRWRGDRWAFRLGNLTNPWGSTDLVRPGDVVNPSDLSNPAAATASGDTLLPQFTAELSYNRPDWTLTGIVVPFFVPNRVVAFGRDTAIANGRNPVVQEQLPVLGVLQGLLDRSRWDDYQPLLLSTEQPDETPKNASLGARITGTVANTDLGLGYFWGWDRTPYAELDEDVRRLLQLAVADGRVLEDYDVLGFAGRNPEAVQLFEDISDKAADGEPLFRSRYLRQHTLVADAARYFGPIGVRADVAMSPARTFYTTELKPVRRPSIYAAVGMSWEEIVDDENFVAVIAEGFVLRPLGSESVVTEAFVDAARSGDASDELLLVGDAYYGAVAAVQWRMPWWDLELEAGGLYGISTGDVALNGRLTKVWQPWLKTSVGATVLEGPEPASQLSLGGLYDHNDQITVGVSGVF
ncbi:MAG: hypothetical protein ACQEVA_05835 [Myxococcota bacterium]